jgi:hypothetical protein
VTQPLRLDQAVEALKRDPAHPVLARVDELTVELRAVPEASPYRTAADAFRDIRWHGDESLDELLEFFRSARREGGSGNVPEL